MKSDFIFKQIITAPFLAPVASRQTLAETSALPPPMDKPAKTQVSGVLPGHKTRALIAVITGCVTKIP